MIRDWSFKLGWGGGCFGVVGLGWADLIRKGGDGDGYRLGGVSLIG